MSETFVQVQKLHKHYHDGERTLEVLRGVDFEISRGESVAIVGASGSGKSTLLNLLGALDRPTSGKILFDGEDLSSLSDVRLDHIRRQRIGLVFQFHHLIAGLRAWENVAMPALVMRRSRSEARRRAEEMLGRVGMAERVNHVPAKLSGGEQQRVALARALMNDPELILADEPTGNLDAETAKEVIEILWEVGHTNRRSLVIVTHDASIAARADRILRLEKGRLIRMKTSQRETGPLDQATS